MHSASLLFSLTILQCVALNSGSENVQPKISLLEIDKRTGKSVEVFKDSISDLDIIFDQSRLSGKVLELNCKASYPVVWLYKGDGVSTMQVTTGVDTIHGLFIDSREFTATGTIGWIQSPKETDTGNYTCQSIQDPRLFTSYYIYVAGENLFVQTKEQTVFYSESDTILRIPCSVSHPDVKLSLQKLTNGVAEFPLNESVSYDPKFGFLLHVPDLSDVEGTYLCNAALYGNNSTEKINVIKHNAIYTCKDGPCLCSSAKCGQNTSCKVYKGKPMCYCLPGTTGNPNYGCTDLRQIEGCRQVCGINSACDYNVNYKEIRCRCLPGFHGDPYHSCQMTG